MTIPVRSPAGKQQPSNKPHSVKSIITTILAAGLLPSAASATLLSQDSFSGYDLGELSSIPSPTITGFTGNWTDVDFGDAEPAVTAGSLSYGGTNYAAGAGGKVTVDNNVTGGEINAANSGRVYRLLDSSLAATDSTAGTLYLSFLFQSGQETGATTYQTLALYDTSTSDANRNFDIGLTNNGGQSGTEYDFGADNAYTSTGVTADTGVHLFVVKFVLSATAASDSATVWVDPDLTAGEPAGGTTVSGKDLTWDRLAFSDYDGNSCAWDEIRWGDTFDSVTTEAILPVVPTFSLQPQDYYGFVGDTVTLTATADSDPAPAYQWEYSTDGTGFSTVVDGGKISGAATSTLTISPAGYADNGYYRVVATNGNGSGTSTEALVENIYPDPAITAQPVGGAVQVGDSASFTVSATGLGTLSYQWYNYNTGMLTDGGSVSGATTATLTVSNVQLADTDEFYCEVTDHAATEDASGEPDTVVSSDNANLEVFEASATDLLSFEPFISYPAGTQLTGQDPVVDGYLGAWLDEAFGSSLPATSAGSLTYGGAGYQTGIGGKAGKAADVAGVADGNSGRAARALAANLKGTALSSRTLYLSWLFQTGNEETADDAHTYQTLALWNGDSGNDGLRVFEAGIAADFGTDNYAFRIGNTTSVDLGIAPDSGAHLFVAKIELSPAAGGDDVTVWLDPALGAGDPVGGMSVSAVDLAFDRVALSDYASNSSSWDEIRWGLTFDSVTIEAPAVPLVPEFTLHPSDYFGDVGDTVVLSAFAEGSPEPSYQWQYSADGFAAYIDVTDGGAFSGATTGELTIQPGAYADSGYYRVVANNGNGGDQISQEAFVELIYPDPVITQQPSSISSEEGSDPSFTVAVSYLGPVVYEWYKVEGGGDILISNGGNISGADTATLQFTGVAAGDVGDYYVVVTDLAGAGDTGSTQAFSVPASLAVFAPWSGLVSEESFDTAAGYTLGVLDSQDPAIGGYTGPWMPTNFGNTPPAVSAGTLDYGDPLYLGSSGEKVSVDNEIAGGEINVANSGRIYRQVDAGLTVDASTSAVRYLSFLFQSGQETGATTYQTLHLNQGTNGDANRAFDIGLTNNGGFSGSEYNFGVNGNYSGTGAAADADVHLFVVKFNLSDAAASDAVTVWIDPTLGGAGDPSGGVVVSGVDLVWDTLMISDYDGNSAAWDEIRWGDSFDSVTLNPNPAADDFAAWIAGYPGVGLLDGFDDDADGDDLSNGVESYMGTDPSVFNQGITNADKSGNSFTFEHPQSATPVSDVSGAYRWSIDLAMWNADGATFGGATVSFSASPDTPVAGTTTVTATITGTAPDAMFVDLEVTRTDP